MNILTSNTNFMLFSTGCVLVFLVERYIYMKEVAVEDEHNGEDRVFKWKAGDWTITGKGPEVNKRSKKNQTKVTTDTLTKSTSFFNSSISFSFFLPLPFFLPPCSEVAASSYCSRPSWKHKATTTTTENEIPFSYRNNFRLSQEALWMIPIMHKLAVKRYKV